MTASTSVRTSTAIADPSNPPNVLIPNVWDATVVTKSDSTVFSPPAYGLYIGGTGNVAVRMFGTQTNVTFVAVQAGTVLPIVVDKVLAAGTSATSILQFSSNIQVGYSFIETEGGDLLITEAGDDLITDS